MNCKSSIRPSHPISEITTSHVCTLKRPEKRVIKDQMFFKSRKWVCIGYKVVDWLQWGRRFWSIPKVGPAHPYFMLSSIFENIMFWLIEIDLKSVYFFLFFFLIWFKSMLALKFIQYTIYLEKKKNKRIELKHKFITAL